MIILGIETSCDETAAAVVQKQGNRVTILSNVVASSASLQAKYGGVIPEQAAREQIKSIIPVIEEALTQAFPDVIPAEAGIYTNNDLWIPDQVGDDRIKKIDAIAVTFGPGLIGSLLVGVETAKTIAITWNKPLIPVNHLIGHFYANWISHPRSVILPIFPCLGLLVSGGHTDLVLFKDHGKYEYLGGTRDDAAGECFDKCARLLGLPYPGGPSVAKLARAGNPKAFDLPRPMIDSNDLDFSFSGLKTAVANLIHTSPVILSAAKNLSRMRDSNKLRDPSLIVQDDNTLANLSASIETAIVDVLVAKTLRAARQYKVSQIMLAGGVAANQKLTAEFKKTINDKRSTINLLVPPAELCTDNAAMIATAAFFLPATLRVARRADRKPAKNPLSVQADPSLALR